MWAAYGGHIEVATFLLTQGSGSGKMDINPPKPLGACAGGGLSPPPLRGHRGPDRDGAVPTGQRGRHSRARHPVVRRVRRRQLQHVQVLWGIRFELGGPTRAYRDAALLARGRSAIERFNPTDRMRNVRKARKTLCFSRRTDRHEALSWIGAVRYNFHHPHRSLRQRTEQGRWQQRSPAMAAGIAEHLYSSLELMRLCPVGLR